MEVNIKFSDGNRRTYGLGVFRIDTFDEFGRPSACTFIPPEDNPTMSDEYTTAFLPVELIEKKHE